jgi:hypothetical protein
MSKLENVPFFTPINFEDRPKGWSDSLLEFADFYFYLGGRTACVISDLNKEGSREITYKEGESSFLSTTLKVISYFTLVFPVIFFVIKAVLRLTSSFHLDEISRVMEYEGEARTRKVKQIVGEGISERAIALFRTLTVQAEGDPEELSIDHEDTMQLKDYPNLKFRKVADAEDEEKLINRLVEVKQLCLEERLNLITFASVKQLEVAMLDDEGDEVTGSVRVQEWFEPSDAATQQRYYQTLSGLDKSLGQLAAYIAKMGIDSLNLERVLIIDTEEDFKGDRRIVILDMPGKVDEDDRINNASYAIFGSGGLIQLVTTEAQLDAVIAGAARYGVKEYNGATVAQIKENLMVGIRAREQLEKGITVTAEELAEMGDSLSPEFDSATGNLTLHGKYHRQNGFTHVDLQEGKLRCFTPYNPFPGMGNRVEGGINQFYDSMLHAVRICLEHKLDRLIVPSAKKVEFIVRPMPEVTSKEKGLVQQVFKDDKADSLYTRFVKQLPEDEELIRQLAIFSVVANALLENLEISFSDSKAVLQYPRGLGGYGQGVHGSGIFGNNTAYGLINYLYSETQIDIALKAAAEHGVSRGVVNGKFVPASEFKAARLKELAEESTKKGVVKEN